ncbi:hypothetical protein L6R52_04705 [Myxococcota bacterium]|nr:hypothetical protein [Myxococcota bacterium]
MNMHAGSRLLGVSSIALGLALFSGCRHHGDMRIQYTQMRPAMLQGDWNTAASQLEAAKTSGTYNEDDRVMFWLNMGTLQHYAGNTAGSNENLVKAEAAMQELWTTSISSEASKVIVSESVQAYEGEDFEKVLVYLYTSLNNVNAGKMQDAIVEARRADEMLKKMLVEFEKEGSVGTLYKQDAFMLWLVGLYYEIEGQASWNDALLAYKAAYKSYLEDYAGQYGTAMPAFIGEDIVRVARLLGQDGTASEYAKLTGASGDTAKNLADGLAEVVLVHGSGEAPYKEELFIDGQMADGYVMRIALPQFKAVPSQVAYAQISANGAEARTSLAEPISEMVLKNFEHRLPAIKLRAIARATVKYAATKAAQAVGEQAGGGLAGALLGLAGNVASAVSEAADLRSWTTLPGAFGVARLWLPAGQHTLTVSYHNASGGTVGRQEQITLELKPGQRKLLSVRSLH